MCVYIHILAMHLFTKRLPKNQFGAWFARPAPFRNRASGSTDMNKSQHLEILVSQDSFFTPKKLPSQKLTWNLEMVVSNRNLLFQGAPIFRCKMFVLGGCNECPLKSLGFRGQFYKQERERVCLSQALIFQGTFFCFWGVIHSWHRISAINGTIINVYYTKSQVSVCSVSKFWSLFWAVEESFSLYIDWWMRRRKKISNSNVGKPSGMQIWHKECYERKGFDKSKLLLRKGSSCASCLLWCGSSHLSPEYIWMSLAGPQKAIRWIFWAPD